MTRAKDRLTALIIASLFFILLGSMALRHNADLSVTTAAFIDSGSLLSDYLIMSSPTATLNQNIQYHAGIYGWAYNALITSGIVVMKYFIAATDYSSYFTQFAIWAKSVSLIATSAGLFFFFIMLRAFSASYVTALILTLLAATFPPLVKFSYEIHPEPLGFLFAAISLWSLKKFCGNPAAGYSQLLLGWAAAIICVMSKQSFLVYPLIPLGVAFFYLLRLPDETPKVKETLKLVALFSVVLVIALLLFHPYALLNPAQFLEKQRSIHAFHSTMFKPIGLTAKSWFLLLSKNDYWMLIAAVFALIRLGINRFRGTMNEKLVDIACIALIMLCIVFVKELRFYIIRAYAYPLIPLAAIVIVTTVNSVPKLGRVLILLATATALPFYATASAGVVARDILTTGSLNMSVHSKLSALGPQSWNVYYSPSLAVPTTLYPKIANAFQLDPTSPQIEMHLKNWAPDVALVDQSFSASPPKVFGKVLEDYGLVRAGAIKGFSLSKLRCDMQAPLNLSQCGTQIQHLLGFDAEPLTPDDEVVIYARPALLPALKTLGTD